MAGNNKFGCADGLEQGRDGVCKKFTSTHCDVKPKDKHIEMMTGDKLQVKVY